MREATAMKIYLLMLLMGSLLTAIRLTAGPVSGKARHDGALAARAAGPTAA
jgi:hypothetical protein